MDLDGYYHELINRSGGKLDIDELDEREMVFILVYAGQGIIDNGGYRYFFENDWPDNPPYAMFINAYREIGCNDEADDLLRVVNSFPFRDPHLDCKKRQEYMDKHFDDDLGEVRGWGDKLCGNQDVWDRLLMYASGK